MCLGVPARVLRVRGEVAEVDFGGIVKEVSSLLVPNIKEGEYVIVHAGAIISKIDEKEAENLIKMWSEVLGVLNEGAGE